MNEAVIRRKLMELIRSVAVSQPSGSGKSGGDEGLYVPDPATKDKPVAEALDQLALQLKYLVFDLEATRRENRYLRQMLESRPPTNRREESDDSPPQF